MTPQPSVGLIVTSQPLEVGAEKAPQILRRAEAALSEMGLAVRATALVSDDPTTLAAAAKLRKADPDALVVVAATWSEDHRLLDLLEETPVPVIAWALPGIHTGSFCGCLQFASVLAEVGRPCRYVYGELDDPEAASRARSYGAACHVARALRRARVGLIGHRTPGMTEVACDELALKEELGPRVVQIEAADLMRASEGVEDAEAAEVWRRAATGGAAGPADVQVDPAEGVASAAVYIAMRRFVEQHRLSALATGCYPDLMGRVCLAHSLLAEEGVPCACEGDVNSALAMLVLQWLSGRPVHNTDPLAVDEEEDTIVGSHCGSGGFSIIAGAPTFGPVRLAGSGLCCLGPAAAGPITMLNLVGRAGTYRAAGFEGEALQTGMVFPGNPIKVKTPAPVRQVLYSAAEAAAGHHWMIGYGHHQETIQHWCRLVGLPYTDLGAG